MNKTWTVIIVIVVLAVVAFGGYKVWHHMQAQQAAMHPAVVNKPATAKPSEMMTENSVYKMVSSGSLGSIMTDTKGMTLYIYSKDTSGVSNCSGACLKAWPAYTAPSNAGTLPANVSVIKRSDGTSQYAWKGMPLYYYVGDKKAGDVNGNGIGGVWSVVK